MPAAYSLNLRVFWGLALVLGAGVLCLLHALLRGGTSSFPLLGGSALLLLCYLLLRYCGPPPPCPVPPRPAPSSPACSPESRRALLESYYEQRLRLSPHLLGHSKAHVRQVLGALLQAGRAHPQEPSLAFRGDLLPLGSAYEQHKVGSPDCFDVLVPLRLPQGLSAELEREEGGMLRCRLLPARRKAGPTPRHFTDPAPSYRHFSTAFCLPQPGDAGGGQPLLCPALLLRWFQQRLQRCLGLIRFQFQERCHISLSSCQDHQLTLHILPRSDYVCCHLSMAVRLIPALSLGESLFLTTYPKACWGINVSRLEQKLLAWFKEQTPANSCHLKCLQIMKGLRELMCQALEAPLAAQCASVLSSYTLKTALFYLLLKGPFQAWAEPFLLERLEDLVLFLSQSLQRRVLLHFFMGNSGVPEVLTLPRLLQEAPPVNLLADFDASLLETAALQLLDTWTRIPHILQDLSYQKYLVKSSSRCHHTSTTAN